MSSVSLSTSDAMKWQKEHVSSTFVSGLDIYKDIHRVETLNF